MAPLQKAHVKMLYDISSPWSNIAFHILLRYRDIWNIDIELVPIFLGGIMVATKNTPPSALKAPVPYLLHDQRRVSNRIGVDTRSPPGHPLGTSSLNQIRFLRFVYHNESQAVLAACTKLIYNEFYAIQTPYTSREFWDCLIPVLGKGKLEHYLKMAQSNQNKEGVKADIQRAVEEYGMFGAPWFVATRPSDGKRDVFFGADKLEAIAWWLGPEYVWRGPYPDGDDAIPLVNLPIQARL